MKVKFCSAWSFSFTAMQTDNTNNTNPETKVNINTNFNCLTLMALSILMFIITTEGDIKKIRPINMIELREGLYDVEVPLVKSMMDLVKASSNFFYL